MRVAVTGAKGFIGSQLVTSLRSRSHDVMEIDLIEEPGVEVIDLRTGTGAVAEFEPDAIVHLAGPVVDSFRRDPAWGYDLQTRSTLNVLELAKETDAHVVLASSFYVYDGIDKAWIVNEETPLDVRLMEGFGVAKFMAEQMCRNYGKAYGVEWTALRFGSAYGPGNGSNVVTDMMKTAALGEEFVVWGEGHRRNQYTHVDSLVDGIELAMERKGCHPYPVFNLINSEVTTTRELATMLERLCGLSVLFDESKSEPLSMPIMDSRKAEFFLGWKTTRVVDGVEALWLQTIGAGRL